MKKIEQILDIKTVGILPLGKDEKIISIANSEDYWISNYGRVLQKLEGQYILLEPVRKNGKIGYEMRYKSTKDEKVTFRYIDKLVYKYFVQDGVYRDMRIWHKGNNEEDNYYKNLYVVSHKVHLVLRKYIKGGGTDTEEVIKSFVEKEKIYELPTVEGVGYLGTDKVDVTSWTYITWHNMMQRAYNEKFHERQPYYKDATVCEEWHNYSVCKKWLEKQYYECGEKLDLDKDLLGKGKKEYSPETCCLLPHHINGIIADRSNNARNTSTPLGVYFRHGKYEAKLAHTENGKIQTLNIGSYDTPEEAFAIYKAEKELYVKQAAQKYKKELPKKTYNALMKWTLEAAG